MSVNLIVLSKVHVFLILKSIDCSNGDTVIRTIFSQSHMSFCRTNRIFKRHYKAEIVRGFCKTILWYVRHHQQHKNEFVPLNSSIFDFQTKEQSTVCSKDAQTTKSIRRKFCHRFEWMNEWCVLLIETWWRWRRRDDNATTLLMKTKWWDRFFRCSFTVLYFSIKTKIESKYIKQKLIGKFPKERTKERRKGRKKRTRRRRNDKVNELTGNKIKRNWSLRRNGKGAGNDSNDSQVRKCLLNIFHFHPLFRCVFDNEYMQVKERNKSRRNLVWISYVISAFVLITFAVRMPASASKTLSRQTEMELHVSQFQANERNKIVTWRKLSVFHHLPNRKSEVGKSAWEQMKMSLNRKSIYCFDEIEMQIAEIFFTNVFFFLVLFDYFISIGSVGQFNTKFHCISTINICIYFVRLRGWYDRNLIREFRIVSTVFWWKLLTKNSKNETRKREWYKPNITLLDKWMCRGFERKIESNKFILFAFFCSQKCERANKQRIRKKNCFVWPKFGSRALFIRFDIFFRLHFFSRAVALSVQSCLQPQQTDRTKRKWKLRTLFSRSPVFHVFLFPFLRCP